MRTLCPCLLSLLLGVAIGVGQMCPNAHASENGAFFKLTVIQMSGQAHEIDKLLPSTTLAELLKMARAAMGTWKDVRMGLIIDDEVLTSRQGDKQLGELRISQDSTLAAVKLSGVDFLESTEDVGDEVRRGRLADTNTKVRVCFLDDSRCMLVRCTNTRSFNNGLFQSRQTFDIATGTYIFQDESRVDFDWKCQYRRVRNGVSETEIVNRIDDSGWIKRDEIPEAWKSVLLQGSTWHRDAELLIDGGRILGMRLSGRGSVEEALRLLALS